jgi:hypothetical protein
MPDTRKHRGAHPEDAALFASAAWPGLREAVAHLSWLLTRGYADGSALKLVGDRFQLAERQRIAVMRCACADEVRQRRRETALTAAELAGQPVAVDGFNVLTTIEAALAGGVILRGRDGCYRDMASMHGSYRKVDETRPALGLIGAALQELAPGRCCWYLDRPVSNSGRLRGVIETVAAERGWAWEVTLADGVDSLLVRSSAVVATADGPILDRCRRWFNLARTVIDQRIDGVVPLPLDP